MSEKMTTCKTCNNEIAKNAKSCPHCGAKNKKSIFTKLWFWFIIILIIGIIASASGPNTNTVSNPNDGSLNSTVSKEVGNGTVNSIESVFAGDSGINASAEIGDSIIGYPEITITITNTTDKEISAIQFYAVPYDVYGEEIKGWTTQEKLYTDTAIAAGKTTTISYQLIEESVKTVKLFLYSVYYEDGTEWGDRNATKKSILEGAPVIEVIVNK